MIREPAVAGTFYRREGGSLATEVDGLLRAAAAGRQIPALGVVVPHAGYVYSGGVAGAVYGHVTVPERVIVLGPNHTGLGTAPAALWPDGAFRTPVGDVPVDEPLTRAIAGAPGVATDRLAHLREHSLEVQLPFLARARPDVRVAALCLSHLSFGACDALGRAIATAADGAGALVVASSDMSHYLSASDARRVDGRAIERILALDPAGLYEVVHRESISMCGVVPVTVMLVAARARGATRAELVRYAHSGEVSGDDQRVVGYAGVVVV